jgi:uncharacterized protein (TIGR03066 family)
MKHLSKRALATLKQRKQKQEMVRKPGPPQGGKFTRWHWAALGLGLLLAGGGTWAALEFFVWNKLPAALVGKWEVQGGPMSGGTFQFFRDGTLETRHKKDQTYSMLRASVAVEGKTLLTTTQDLRTGQEQTRKSTIRELTANSLAIELEDGAVLKMVRAK